MKYLNLRFIILIYILISFNSIAFAQKGSIGLGVKAGDPTGLTAKFYSAENAIELVVGRGHYFSGYYNDKDYYEDRFDDYDNFKGKGYKFHRYSSGTPIAVQLHFLKQQRLKSYKELDWYLGVGPQFRAFRVDYYYRDKYNDVYYERITDYDLGIDGVIGLEYTFKDLPLSIFADVNLFVEIIDQPFMLSIQGGVGVRYNLK